MKEECKTLRDQSLKELMSLHKEEERKFFEMINEKQVSKKLDKPHLLRATKKTIARILTIIGEKEREEA